MQVFISNVVICNSDGESLPLIVEIPAYVKKFTPSPIGNSGKLYFKVSFTTLTGAKGGNSFSIKATAMDPAFYLFTDKDGDFESLQFPVNANESPVLLEFKLKNLIPLNKSILARLKMSVVTENSSQKTVFLKPVN
jgi:hypothetical protein